MLVRVYGMRYFMLFVLNLVFVQRSQIIDFNSSFGALDTNRTCDPPLRRGMLYPLSYEGVIH